jgi:hypothetical protein
MAELVNAAQVSHEEDESSDFVNLSDLVGQPLILESLGHKTLVTRFSPESDVVACLVHVWDGKTLTFVGEAAVFWQKVKKALDASDGPIAGIITKGARSYFFDPVDDATYKKMAAQFAA